MVNAFPMVGLSRDDTILHLDQSMETVGSIETVLPIHPDSGKERNDFFVSFFSILFLFFKI